MGNRRQRWRGGGGGAAVAQSKMAAAIPFLFGWCFSPLNHTQLASSSSYSKLKKKREKETVA
jgi:hypothetical protein